MIKDLFEHYKIKLIVSVDDCHLNISEENEEEIRDILFREMIYDLKKFEIPIQKIGRGNDFESIKEIMSISGNVDTLINNFLNSLSENELFELYNIITDLNGEKKSEPDKADKEKILNLLDRLKNDKCIEEYKLFSTPNDALNYNFAEISPNESVLWLIDLDFTNVGGSPEAGLELAKTIAGRKEGPNNYIYILSGIDQVKGGNEEEIEAKFDQYLLNYGENNNENGEIHSLLYCIYKQRIIPKNPEKFDKSIANGFKRMICFKIFDLYANCFEESLEKSTGKLRNIRQNTLNFLLNEKVEKLGESYIDFLERLVNIFQMDSYKNNLSKNRNKIAEEILRYQEVCDYVEDRVGDEAKETEKVKEFRRLELYDKYVNSRHLEISTGDIFKIEDEYYFLATQSCDTFLHNGERLLQNATLLKIENNSKYATFKYDLQYFEEYKKPIINFHQSPLNFPFEILDLCVLNQNGSAEIFLRGNQGSGNESDWLKYFTKSYKNRIEKISFELNLIVEKCPSWDSVFTIGDEDKDKEIKDKEIEAFKRIDEQKPKILRFQKDESNNKIYYDVQRVCRINEMIAVDIVNKYGNYLTRVGHAFDFVKNINKYNYPV